ncbi:hypothetical protein L249_7123 [Ophiocordyceps polyrhachis-furcata BCC 54312]|uniref:nitric oxide dioxygenase n=1 Tax=Ophiocordyceps polyrhachis-furcata BCC 54312 TaxID=1330021 RepID=A0A367LA39_9HYPO|nr:hypothetical protein L249_7123 [Ophiocordyceps polyrhachis-furcata BCC 54312]
MALTAEQISLVKSTAPVIKQHGQAITTVFYRRILAAHPELKSIFSLRNQHTGAQQAALAGAVFAYASYIDDLSALEEAIDRIAHKHASLFVRPDQYPVVGKFLVDAFADVLGAALTEDAAQAWIAAYHQLADVLIRREKKLYDEAGAWDDWRAFTLADKVPEADDIVSLYLKPTDGRPLPRFLPGQFVSVRIPMPELGGLFQSRQFSLSTKSGHRPELYRISVKREPVEAGTVEERAQGRVPGLVSNRLHDNLVKGDEVELSPPRGRFVLDGVGDAPVVFLSLGVGVTPLMSMLQSIVSDSSRPVVSWVQGARRASAVCFGKSIRAMAAGHGNVKALIFVKNVDEADVKGADYDVHGRLDMSVAQDRGLLHLSDSSAGYYICGPADWMLETKTWLSDRGVASERIHVELFGVA